MIDAKDFSILKIVEDADKPLWKKEIHKRIQDAAQDIPAEPFSIQTVGRRVDALYEDDLLAARIMNPEAAQRTLITTYRTTESGREAIDEYRDSRLRQHVVGFVEAALEDGSLPSDRSIEALFAQRFGFDRTTIRGRLDTQEVLCLSLIYFLQERIDALQELEPTITAIPTDGQLRAPVEEYLL